MRQTIYGTIGEVLWRVMTGACTYIYICPLDTKGEKAG